MTALLGTTCIKELKQRTTPIEGVIQQTIWSSTAVTYIETLALSTLTTYLLITPLTGCKFPSKM